MDRRGTDPWRQLVEHRLESVEEKLEKNNMMTREMLEAWDTVRGGLKALEFFARGAKLIGAFAAAIAAVWGAVEFFFRRGG